MALEASKSEYEAIVAEMKQAAQQGSFEAKFANISDGARKQLEEAGFIVTQTAINKSAFGSQWGWKVSFKGS